VVVVEGVVVVVVEGVVVVVVEGVVVVVVEGAVVVVVTGAGPIGGNPGELGLLETEPPSPGPEPLGAELSGPDVDVAGSSRVTGPPLARPIPESPGPIAMPTKRPKPSVVAEIAAALRGVGTRSDRTCRHPRTGAVTAPASR
jgi:hypothetical protein